MDGDSFELETFPCFYTFKIVGRRTEGFAERVRDIVAAKLGAVPLDCMKLRDSAGGKYQSVTIEIYVNSKALLEQVYLDLKADEDVLLFV